MTVGGRRHCLGSEFELGNVFAGASNKITRYRWISGPSVYFFAMEWIEILWSIVHGCIICLILSHGNIF